VAKPQAIIFRLAALFSGGAFMLVEHFPLIFSAAAVLCLLAFAADASCK
jgi:hypothetical protein